MVEKQTITSTSIHPQARAYDNNIVRREDQQFWRFRRNKGAIITGTKLENKGEFCEDSSDLNKRYVLFVDRLRALFEEHNVSPEEYPGVLECLNEAFGPKAMPPIPTAAPELYKERADRKEKPEAFLRRVYGPWLNGNGLYRPHVRTWDFRLYEALNQKKPEDFDALLPKAQGQSTVSLGLSDRETLNRKRQQVREAVQRHRDKISSRNISS